jgi:Yip1-like protein
MSTTPAAAGQAPLSEPARIINTFVAPGSTFADIRSNQSWWVPWLLISAMAIGYFAVLGQKIGYEQIARNEIQKSSRYEQFEKLPAEQRDRQIQLTANITRYIGFAAPVTTLIVYLVVAGVLLATFNFGAGAEVTFKQAMAISLYATLPMLLFYVLAIVSLIIGVDPEGFNIRNIAATNPAYFMDSTQNKFLYGLASGLDVFAIWSIVLTGIGYSSVSKLKRSTAILIVAGWYVVYKLGGAALSLLG